MLIKIFRTDDFKHKESYMTKKTAKNLTFCQPKPLIDHQNGLKVISFQ